METKKVKKTQEKADMKFTDEQNTLTIGYNKVAFIHSKFSSLVSSGTVYSMKYTPKKKRIIK